MSKLTPNNYPAFSLILRLNLHRRHLDSSQRAAIAIDVLPMLEEEARERQKEAGKLYGENHPKELVQLIEQALEYNSEKQNKADILLPQTKSEEKNPMDSRSVKGQLLQLMCCQCWRKRRERDRGKREAIENQRITNNRLIKMLMK